MPTPTYVALATTTLGANASSVTFSSIPATYRDLVLVVGGATTAGATMLYALNGDTTDANYSRVRMFAGGAGPGGSNTASDRFIANMDATQGVQLIYFMDYSATDKHKTVLSRSSNTGTFTLAYVSRWANTAAVTSINFGSGEMITGTVLSLYGIEA